MTTFTKNFRFTKPDFNSEGWDTAVNNDLDAIDALIGQFNTGLSIQGVWLNATLYTAGQAVVDALTGHIWLLSATYTTPAAPTTFAQDRITNPTYWTDVTNPAIPANQSAINAATSATAAATSATAAAGSATAAAGSATTAQNAALAIRSYIAGLILSNDGGAPNTKLDVAAGTCMDSTNTTNITLGAFTKTTGGAWTAGTGNNGMGVGLTIANSTWYHVFAIIVAGVADIYFDTSVSGANKPAGTTALRRIGSIKTDGAAHIIAFSQNDEEFLWAVTLLDVNAIPLGTGVLAALTVPLGVKVNALFRAAYSDSSVGSSIVFTSPDETDQTAAVAGGSMSAPQASVSFGSAAQFNVRTNTSQQIRYRATTTTTNTIIIHTYGFIDTRGRNA